MQQNYLALRRSSQAIDALAAVQAQVFDYGIP
jgi:hypothetical protein